MRNEKKHSRTQPRNADNNNMKQREKNSLTPSKNYGKIRDNKRDKSLALVASNAGGLFKILRGTSPPLKKLVGEAVSRATV